MALTIGTTSLLNNGVRMPLFGLGTWEATGDRGRKAVTWALEAGYRLIDTAAAYDNEAEVGRGIRESGVSRDEVFVTTKLWPSRLGYESALQAFEESRRRLALEWVDLYLIHWPGDDRKKRAEAWRALETLLVEGRCRAIGVSNYSSGDLEDLKADGRVTPSVNQVPFSPFHPQAGLHEFCRTRGILLQGYSPLTRGRNLDDPAIERVARAIDKTAAQVVLRWALQKGVAVIPKSVQRAHILENAAVFDFSLGRREMAELDALRPGPVARD
jgi:diketogulonate reductase-like aldo/keto reductase